MLIEHVTLTKERDFQQKNGSNYYSINGAFGLENENGFSISKLDLPENTLFYVDSISENSSQDGSKYFYGKLAIQSGYTPQLSVYVDSVHYRVASKMFAKNSGTIQEHFKDFS